MRVFLELWLFASRSRRFLARDLELGVGVGTLYKAVGNFGKTNSYDRAAS